MLAERSTDVVGVAPARHVRGHVRVPGDKSISHRAALFNAIADGEARITNFSAGADCASSLACVARLGAAVERRGDVVRLRGAGLDRLVEPADVLDCGNSGTSMRLLCGLLAGAGRFAILSGDESLRARPMARVVEPLRAMGARIDGRAGGRLPPLAIAPAERLRGLEHRPRVASAQVKSALLLAGLAADAPTTIVEAAPTRDHTERLLGAMGARVEVDGRAVTIRPVERLRATDVAVPGDFSSAAYWLVAACLHPRAEVRVEHVGLNPTRTGLLTILERMGASVEVADLHDEAGEPVGDLVAWSSRLHGTTVDGELVPLAIDELPLVALLGLFAEGETVVRDAAELRVKESDRVAVVAEGLRALGGDVEATADGWRIRGTARPAGSPGGAAPGALVPARVHSRGDHRLAMLFALAGALGAGAEVEGADAVAVSYPGFWDTLAEVTG
jgi:3-phosphoshikimate 1-carboxyvinyltransferase